MTANIKHLRTKESRGRPSPSSLARGQILLNIDGEEPGIYFKTTGDEIVKTGSVYVGNQSSTSIVQGSDTAGTFVKGELWFDSIDKVLKVLSNVDDGYEEEERWITASGFGIDNDDNFSTSGRGLVVDGSLSIKGSGRDSYFILPTGDSSDEGEISGNLGMLRYDTRKNTFRGFVAGKWVDFFTTDGSSSNNLGVNNLTAGGDVILGTGCDKTLTVNSSSTFKCNSTFTSEVTFEKVATFTDDVKVSQSNGLKFLDNDSDGSHFIQIKAPSALTADVTWTLPATDNASAEGQLLGMGAGGQLTWMTSPTAGNLITADLNVPNDLTVAGNTTLGDGGDGDIESLTVNSESTFNESVTCKKNLTLDDSGSVLNVAGDVKIGENEVGKSLRIYNGATRFIEFKAPSNGDSRTYIWPENVPGANDTLEFVGGDTTSGIQLGWKTNDLQQIHTLTISGESGVSPVGRGNDNAFVLASGKPLVINKESEFNKDTKITSTDTNSSSPCLHVTGTTDKPVTFTECDVRIEGGKMLKMYGVGGSNYVGIKAPNGLQDPLTFTLPKSQGTTGQVLTVGANNGQLEWTPKSEPNRAGGNYETLSVRNITTLTGTTTIEGTLDVNDTGLIKAKKIKISGTDGLVTTKVVSSGPIETPSLTVTNSSPNSAVFRGGLQIEDGKELRFYEDSGTNYTSVRGPTSASVDNVLILPGVSGTQNQYLKVNSVSGNRISLGWGTLRNLQDISWSGNIEPNQDKTHNIGSSTNRVKEIHAETVIADRVETKEIIDTSVPLPNLLDNAAFDVWTIENYESHSDGVILRDSEKHDYVGSSDSFGSTKQRFGPNRWFVWYSNEKTTGDLALKTKLTLRKGSHSSDTDGFVVKGNLKSYMRLELSNFPSGSSEEPYIGQRIEYPNYIEKNKLSLSFYIRGVIGGLGKISGVYLVNGLDSGNPMDMSPNSASPDSGPFDLTDGWDKKEYTFDFTPNRGSGYSEGSYIGVKIVIDNTSSASIPDEIHLSAVKLEEGDKHTLMKRENPATEEVNSRRYYQAHPFYDVSDKSSGDRYTVKFNPSLRITPKLNFYSQKIGYKWDLNIVGGSDRKKEITLLVDALEGIDESTDHTAYLEAFAEF